MRTVLIIAVAALVIVSVCLWANCTIVNSYKVLAEQTAKVHKAIAAENWDKAQESLQSLKTHLRQVHLPWSVMINHRDLEEAEILVSQLQTQIQEKSKPEALAAAAALQLQLDFIARDEVINLQNIF